MATTLSSSPSFSERPLNSIWAPLPDSKIAKWRCYYLTVHNDLPGFGKSKEEVYTVITNTGRNPRTVTNLKESCCVFFKWFFENIVSRWRAQWFCTYPLESLPQLHITHWRLNFGISSFNTCATYKATSSSSPHGPKMILLPYRMLLRWVLLVLTPLSTILIAYLLLPSTLALQIHSPPPSPKHMLCQRLNRILLHLSLHWPLKGKEKEKEKELSKSKRRTGLFRPLWVIGHPPRATGRSLHAPI